MKAKLIAIMMAMGPPLLFQFQLSSLHTGFDACVNKPVNLLLQTLANFVDGADPVLFLVSAIPFVLLALVWLFLERRNKTFLIWVVLTVALLVLLLPPNDPQRCYASEYAGEIVLFVPLLAILPTLWIAIWNNPSRRDQA